MEEYIKNLPAVRHYIFSSVDGRHSIAFTSDTIVGDVKRASAILNSMLQAKYGDPTLNIGHGVIYEIDPSKLQISLGMPDFSNGVYSDDEELRRHLPESESPSAED
jgi:hypothetical protein